MGASPCSPADVSSGGKGRKGPAATGDRRVRGRCRLQLKSELAPGGAGAASASADPRIPRERQEAGVPPRLWTGAKANSVCL